MRNILIGSSLLLGTVAWADPAPATVENPYDDGCQVCTEAAPQQPVAQAQPVLPPQPVQQGAPPYAQTIGQPYGAPAPYVYDPNTVAQQAYVAPYPVVPYAGLGWGRAPGAGSGWGLTLDLGVIFQGEGEVTLTPVIPAGSPLNDPIARQALQILLDREEQDLQDDIADYDMYPVVSLGISYRF